MNVSALRKFLILGCIVMLPFAAMAWGVLGHRIIGQVADSYLSKDAKQEIFKILGHESVAMSSNWADFIKSDSTYDYLNTWHYINIAAGKSREQVMAILDADTSAVYARINFLTRELKNKHLEQAKKVMYLRLLIHFVGDIHQPLHVGRPGDRGEMMLK